MLAKFDGGKLDDSAEFKSVNFDCDPRDCDPRDGSVFDGVAKAGLKRSLGKVPGPLYGKLGEE